MIVNIAFLVLIVVSIIRTVSYGVYCIKRSVIGGISVFVLAFGVVFCGVTIWLTGIQ